MLGMVSIRQPTTNSSTIRTARYTHLLGMTSIMAAPMMAGRRVLERIQPKVLATEMMNVTTAEVSTVLLSTVHRTLILISLVTRP